MACFKYDTVASSCKFDILWLCATLCMSSFLAVNIFLNLQFIKCNLNIVCTVQVKTCCLCTSVYCLLSCCMRSGWRSHYDIQHCSAHNIHLFTTLHCTCSQLWCTPHSIYVWFISHIFLWGEKYVWYQIWWYIISSSYSNKSDVCVEWFIF